MLPSLELTVADQPLHACQTALDEFMRSDSSSASTSDGELFVHPALGFDLGVGLLPSERLQVHMDCMNALGQIITIEDVDDIGGSVSLFRFEFVLPNVLFFLSTHS